MSAAQPCGLAMRAGTPADVDALAALYDALNDHLAATHNWPGWRKGVYPTREDAAAGVRDGCLFVAEANGQLAGSLILRHAQEPAYADGAWQAALPDDALLVLHTFVVSPQFQHRGVGAALLAFAERHARETGVRALRLDVYEHNAPAIALYERCGFRRAGVVSLGLEARGLDWFYLYDKML